MKYIVNKKSNIINKKSNIINKNLVMLTYLQEFQKSQCNCINVSLFIINLNNRLLQDLQLNQFQ